MRVNIRFYMFYSIHKMFPSFIRKIFTNLFTEVVRGYFYFARYCYHLEFTPIGFAVRFIF
jgi:hypothetical protein